MKRLQHWDMPESIIHPDKTGIPKRKSKTEGFGMVTNKTSKGHAHGALHCAKCGTEVKVFVSPKRNPHSSKLGRAMSMKDHDLCRRCWRRVMHQQRKEGVLLLPMSLFVGPRSLQPRLLVPQSYSMPKAAS